LEIGVKTKSANPEIDVPGKSPRNIQFDLKLLNLPRKANG
jgi:hypothetical protein